MGEWKEYKIKDLGLVVTGKTPSSTFPEEFGSEMPFVTPTDFRNYRKRTSFAERNLSSKGIEKLRNKVLPPSSVLVTCIGSDMGKVVMNRVPVITNQQINAIIPNQELVSPDFLYYMLVDCYETLRMYSQAGTAVPILNKGDFEEINLTIPSDLSEQKTIASILSSLDDKIDLLHRQNKTLESLAETLFRQWFVEGNENNNGEKLSDFVESANTGLDAIKRAPIVEYDTGVKCLRIQDISQNKTIDRWGNSEVEKNNFKRFQLKRDDIIMARTCSPGINLFIREDLPSVFNNGLVRIRARKDKVHPILLNCLFKTRKFIGHIDGISGGTSVQLNMQVGDLLSYDFSFPPIERQNEIIESPSSIRKCNT